MKLNKKSVQSIFLLLVTSLILGFLMAALVARLTATYDDTIVNKYDGSIVNGLCSGITHPEKYIRKYTAGGPLQWSKQETILLDNCSVTPIDSSIKNEITKKYVTSWQFYVDGFLWAIPMTLLGYIIKKNYANYRH